VTSASADLTRIADGIRPAPCRHHTVPKRVGETTLEQWRPVSSDRYARRWSRDFRRRRTHWRGKGIPRALVRNTTITRLPRSIATAFPSATRADEFTRGTDGSNPSPSSRESANHRFLRLAPTVSIEQPTLSIRRQPCAFPRPAPC
jgi:hypothetical protein